MSDTPWDAEERGNFEPYIHEKAIFTERVNIVPPWTTQKRINPQEQFQKEEQGHGYHGWWESGKTGGGGGPDAAQAGDNQQTAADATMTFLNDNPNGFTLSIKDGVTPTTGFQVGGVVAPLFVDPNSPDSAAQVEKYVKDNGNLLSRDDMHLGGWLGDDGRYVIEVSQQIQDPKAAAEAALERNQNSFWDNAQAKQNDDTKASGVMPDGKMYVPPADPSKGDGLPNPLQLSYGTGDFGVVNPMTKEGVQPIVSPNGDAAIKPSINGRDTASSEGMSQAWRDKAEARMAEAQMPDHQTMADNVTSLVERASAQQWVDGKTFYPRANAEARDIASTTNGIITPYQAAGVIAALSPNTAVGSNMTGARFVCQAVATNMVMHFDQQFLKDYNSGILRPNDKGEPGAPFNIQNDTPIMEQPTRDDAAAAVLAYMKANEVKEGEKWGEPSADGTLPGVGLNSGTSGIGKAIDIASGFQYEDPAEAATPENTLGATGVMKERDFFNNIINPNDTRSCTIDGWQVGALKGTGEYNSKISDTEKKNAETYKTIMRAPASAADNNYKGGCYALAVDAVNTAADQISQQTGYSVNNIEAQAISWIVVRADAKSTPQTAGNTPVRPSVNPSSGPAWTAFGGTQASTQWTNAVAMRPLLSQKAAATALAKQYPGTNFGPVTSIYGVKCNDGTVAFALPDSEMQSLMDAKGDLGATGHVAQGSMEKYGMSVPTKEDIQTVVSTVADLHERDPLNWSYLGYTNALTGKDPANKLLPPLVTLRGPDSTKLETGFDPFGGLQGWTTPAVPNEICLNASVLSRDHVNSDFGWHMPAGDTVSVQQYVATHEYGHLNEFATQHTPAGNRVSYDVKSAFMAANKFSATQPPNSDNSLSQYGRENAHEAYAEAYTEVSITKGDTSNAVAQIYDRIFDWSGTHGESQNANVAALAVKSGLSPARVEQQLKNHPELGGS